MDLRPAPAESLVACHLGGGERGSLWSRPSSAVSQHHITPLAPFPDSPRVLATHHHPKWSREPPHGEILLLAFSTPLIPRINVANKDSETLGGVGWGLVENRMSLPWLLWSSCSCTTHLQRAVLQAECRHFCPCNATFWSSRGRGRGVALAAARVLHILPG